MNKAELVAALESRLGSKKAAAEALEAIVDTIQRTVARGEKVAISGFGSFEKAARGPRVGRNPRTGATVKIKKTSVPRFKPGTAFKGYVADPRSLPKVARSAARAVAGTVRAAAKTAPTPARAAKTATARTPATKTAPRATKATTRTGTRATKTAPAPPPAARATRTGVRATKTTTRTGTRATKTTTGATPAAKTTTRAAGSRGAKAVAKAPAKTTATKAPARRGAAKKA